VLKKAAIIAGSATSLMALAPIAHADSADNDGVNVANDNNVSVAPVQLCGSALAGTPLFQVLSPEQNQCVNAPLVDHPSSQG
jgi:hypothetical protein